MPNVRTVANMVILTRAEARALGLSRYYLGSPCNHGHYSERMVSDSHCVACKRVKAKRNPPPTARNDVRLERYGQYWKDYYQRNKARKVASVVKRAKDRRATDPVFKLRHNIRSRIGAALRGKCKSGSAIALLGCTVEEAKRHIEAQFLHGMSWKNWGEWHVDHIKPLASFDLGDLDQLARACHFTNLQPLWALDNLTKGARYAA